MKKTFALIMALALTITCLVGCGSKDAGSEAGGATTQNAYERISRIVYGQRLWEWECRAVEQRSRH